MRQRNMLETKEHQKTTEKGLYETVNQSIR